MMAKQSRAIAVTEHDNKYPECLHLKISGEPLAPESKGLFSPLKKSDPEVLISSGLIFLLDGLSLVCGGESYA